MKRLLAVSAAGEAATGLVLLAHPPIVVRLLFGAEIAEAGILMSRIAGISLVALGVACWPGGAVRALHAMLTYSALVTLYFVYLGLSGEWTGALLWPATGAHAVLTILLAAARFMERTAPERNGS
jgi:hypothetical protein